MRSAPDELRWPKVVVLIGLLGPGLAMWMQTWTWGGGRHGQPAVVSEVICLTVAVAVPIVQLGILAITTRRREGWVMGLVGVAFAVFLGSAIVVQALLNLRLLSLID